jgi:hypothetical protein
MADERIDIDVNVNDQQVDKAAEKFVPLRRQIRETTVQLQALESQGKQNSKEFQDLSTKLDSLRDRASRVGFASKDLADKLGALPGPVGQVGRQVQIAKDAFETFGKTTAIILGIVGAIVGAFVLMRNALASTAEGQEKLNKITIIGEQLLNGIFAVVEPLANIFADLVISLLGSSDSMLVFAKAIQITTAPLIVLGNALTFIVDLIKDSSKNLGTYAKAFANVGGAISEFFKGNFSEAKRLSDEADRLFLEGLQADAKVFKEAGTKFITNTVNTINGIDDAFIKGTKRKTKTQKKNAENDAKLAEEEKKRKQDAINANEALQQSEDELAESRRVKNADEIKALQEAQLYKDKELIREQARITALMALEKEGSNAYKTLLAERTALEATYNTNKAETDKTIAEKNKEKSIKDADEARALLDGQLQDRFNYLGRLNDLIDNDFAQDRERLAEQKANLDAQEKNALSNVALTEFERTQLTRKFADERNKLAQEETNIAIAEAKAKHQIAEFYINEVGRLGSILSSIAGDNKTLAIAGIIIEQGAALGKVLIDASRGIGLATASAAPFLANPVTAIPATANLARVIAQIKITAGISAAGIIAGAAKGISSINKAQIPGGGGASAGGATAGGGASIPAFSTPTIGAPQIGATAAPQSQLAGLVTGAIQQNNSQQRPIRAYVVGSDVTTEQQLDRRVRLAARLGG